MYNDKNEISDQIKSIIINLTAQKEKIKNEGFVYFTIEIYIYIYIYIY